MVIEKITFSRMFIMQLFLLIFLMGDAIADFTGPFTVVGGKLGEASNEFVISHDDMGDSVPSIRSINSRGNIFLVNNGQVNIFDYKGDLLQIVKPKNVKETYGWPAFMDADSQNNIYTSNYDNKLQEYSIQGELLWEKEVIVGRIAVQPDDTIIIWGYRPDKKGVETLIRFSPTGQLLKTYTERPLELGMVKEKGLGSGKYESTVEFPDHTYKVSSTVPKYSRDILTNLYVGQIYAKKFEGEVEDIICYRVIRVDRCTGEECVFETPRSEYAGYSPEEINAPAPRQEIKIEYGEPIVSPLGDLYCWARTKTEYKILKWTWQGLLDAPQSLRAASSNTGITLTWEQPQKDAGDVTDYEINRSSTVCGPFRPINTVKKGVLTYEDRDLKKGETYYYQIRAIRDKTPSGYSNKAIGKR